MQKPKMLLPMCIDETGKGFLIPDPCVLYLDDVSCKRCFETLEFCYFLLLPANMNELRKQLEWLAQRQQGECLIKNLLHQSNLLARCVRRW